MPRTRRAPDQQSSRKQAEKAGRRAEMLCALFLRLKGYRILATRHKSPVGEIDIIARRGKVLIAIEVKNRPNRQTALFALRPRQQVRIARALECYAGQIGHDGDLRFDLMMVHGLVRVEHLRNAWHAS
ncbi:MULTISPECIES: YraN family protein [unclassified Thalassospira]|uniref:YraN family protein n=1 Tax=unclassified Thalassospira TaxID=2648997 RepID=UPI001B2F33C4|nr:YraN family protein [Thalassospira sp.]MBO6770320.1 YraN family protein [Thalassospira sp.]